MSDDSIVILDPQQQIYPTEPGKKIKLKNFFQSPKYDSHQSCFLSYFNCDKSPKYNGTIFRFPLRRKECKSQIKPEGVYDTERVISTLFEPLKKEADSILIFLKNVKSIKLSTKSKLLKEEFKFSVEVPGNYHEGVERCNSSLLTHVSSKDFHKNIRVTISLYPITSSNSRNSKVWLVLNMIGYPNSSEFNPGMNLDYLPWIGIAMETGITETQLETSQCISLVYEWDGNNLNDFIVDIILRDLKIHFTVDIRYKLTTHSGKLFCFLPTPEPSHLPFNFHGYFALSNDRRRIKWPTLDSNDNESNWNKRLIKHLGVSAYVMIFRILVQCFHHENPVDYQYRLLNGQFSDPTSLSGILVNQGLDELVECKIVYSCVTKEWMEIDEGLYHPQQYENIKFDCFETKSAISALMTFLHQPLVQLPDYVIDVFNRNDAVTSVIQENRITPARIRQIILTQKSLDLIKYFVDNIKRNTLIILAFILSDLSEFSNIPLSLNSIPLLISNSSEISEFSTNSISSLYIYQRNLNLIELFPGAECRFVDTSTPTEIYSFLLQISQKLVYQINIKDISNLRTDTLLMNSLFQTSLNSCSCQKWNPNCSPYNRTWIRLVWSFIGSDEGLARQLGSLPLLPKEDLNSVNNQLISIIPTGHSSVYTFYSNIKKYKILEDTLVESGVVFLHCNRFIECLDSFVIKPIPDGLLTIFEANNNILKLFISELMYTNEELFITLVDVLNKNNSLNYKHKHIILQLPIFPNMNCNYVCLANNNCVRVPAGLKLPSQIEYPTTYLSPNLSEYNTLYNKLDIMEPDLNSFVENHLIIFIQRMRTFSFELSVCLLNKLLKFSDSLINKLRDLNCILDNRSNTPVSCKPGSLFDPDDVIMKELLPSNSRYFPNTQYSVYFDKTKSKHLFNTSTRLKDQSLFEQVIQTALNNFNVSITNSKELWEQHFLQFLHFLFISWKSTDLEISSTVTKTLLRHEIVLPLSERPPSYPKALLFVGEQKLYTLQSVVFCTNKEAQLIAGSEVCVPIFTCCSYHERYQFESLLKHLKCRVSVTGEMLVKQLNIICDTKFLRTDTQNIHNILCEIYNSESIINLTDGITEKFVFVKSKNIFIDPQIISKNLKYPLEPYYYSFDKLSYSERAWRLFSECGAVEDITANQLYFILYDLYHGRKHIPESFDNHTIARIIEELSECKDKLHFEEYFLLCSDNLLHLSTDCLVSDSERYQNETELVEDDKTYFIVNSLISKTIAQIFGAQSVKDTLLGNSWGFCEFVGQYEELTTRIKSILKDYESSIDVFKEMVQNADDAKANTVKVLIDYHSYPSATLVEPIMKHWQGPALYFYNDAQFTKKDFQNIMKIFGETKIDDSMKIGKFGLGFNTVYHLTDVPSFVSGRFIHFLDPHRQYIVGDSELSKPGIKVDFITRKNSMRRYQDQFDVFNLKMFECNIFKHQPYNGTLFRLPFRLKSVSSQISNNTYDNSRITKLLSRILNEAESSIRFLQHVNCIEIYERKETSKEVLKLRISKGVVRNSFPKHETFISQNLDHINSIPQPLVIEPVSYHQLISISTDNCGQKTIEKYIFSFSTGTEQCRQFLLENHSQGVKYTPVCSIAFPLSGIGQSNHDSLCKTIYCFLPLPITSPYPMLINGCFALDQSRRAIACTQDGSTKTKWNQALINDALVNAFIHLLIQIRTYFSQNSEFDISLYYSLWPLSEQTHILWEDFPKSFATRLIKTDVDLFYNELLQDYWISYSDSNFIVYESYYRDIDLNNFFVFARKKYLDKNINLIEIKKEIQNSHLFKIFLQNDTNKNYTLERMCRDLLFPEIHLFTLQEINLILTTLLPLLLLPNQNWIKQLISQTHCIPCGCETDYSLLLPARVVSPHSSVARLFYPADKRTIHPELSGIFAKKSDCYKALKKLDVIESILPVDDVIDRCIYQLDTSIPKREEHCMTILQYLNSRCTYSTVGYNEIQLRKLRTELLKIDFIPVWEDNFLRKLGLQQYKQFATPPQCSPYTLRYISPLHTCIVTEQVDELSELKQFLGLESTSDDIHIDSLISLLHTLHDKEGEIHRLKLEQELGRRADLLFTAIYSHWVNSKEGENFILSDNIKTLKWIWHGQINSFCHVSTIVTSDKYSRFKTKYLPTFPYELNDTNLSRVFFNTVGVRTDISPQEAYDILSRISDDSKSRIIQSKELFVEFIICLINNSLKDYTCCDNKKVLLSSNLRLCIPSELKVDDMTWSKASSSENKQTEFVHDDIHPRVAFNLGAKSIRSNNFTMKEFTITNFGQYEEIGDRINNLKREFPCDVTIFKELLQNAEDAGATEVVFVLDEIKYSNKKESLCFSLDEQPNWQNYQDYTSLLVYNDSSFSEGDMEGIQSLGLGGKKDKHTIGKFGLGFNAVYHLTDSPCLLTRRRADEIVSFCVFDPFRKFLKIQPEHRPGIRLNFTSAELKRFPHQFNPYSFESLPDLTKGDYSILKLPLTNEEIKMEEMLTKLVSQVSNYIIFLQNIQRISVLKRDKDGTHILGRIHVTVTQFPQLPQHYLTNSNYKYLDNVHIINKEISTKKDVTSSASRKRNKQSPENTSSWLLFTNNGRIEQLERFCPDITTHKRIYEKEKLTQVYGGVAVEIPVNSCNASRVGGSCLYSYLPIGCDTPSKFPILINAQFILQPERQLIRFKDVSETSPDDWADIWNSVIIQHVITPLFVSLLLYLKDKSMLENILEDRDSENYYNWYYSLYPDVVYTKKRNEQNNNFLYALCKNLYTTLYNMDESILVDHTYQNWFCLHGKCNGVFNLTPYSYISAQPEWQVSLHKRVRSSNPDKLSLCLCKIKFPLTPAPDRIRISFQEYSHTLKQLNPSYLLSYLNNNPCNWCIPLHNASALSLNEIELLLSFILQSGSIQMHDNTTIPLKVDREGNLGSFSKYDVTFKSKYSDLLPHCADKFICSNFPNSCIEKLVINKFIVNLTVEFLSKNLKPENFNLQDHCLFWTFIFDSGFQCFQLIKEFGKYDLIPVKTKSKRSFTLVSNLSSILYQNKRTTLRLHSKVPTADHVVSQDDLYNALVNMNCPELCLERLNINLFDVCKLYEYLTPSSICKEITTQSFLSAVKLSTMDAKKVDFRSEANSLRNLFYNSDLNEFPLEDIRIISSLKIFLSNRKELCSIADFSGCYITDAKFKIGNSVIQILTSNNIGICDCNERQNSLISFLTSKLAIDVITENSLFLNYIIPHFTQLGIQEQKQYLLYIQNNISDSSTHRKDFICKLNSVKFINHTKTDKLCSLKDFYSHRVELFRVFFPDDILPTEWRDTSCYRILCKIGLRHEIGLNSILTAAKLVQNNSEDFTTEQLTIPLSSLVNLPSDDFQSHYHSELKQLSKIPFLPMSMCNPINGEFIKKCSTFEDAELSSNKLFCCTASYIHDPLVDSLVTTSNDSYHHLLKIRLKPKFDIVIKHFENICLHFTQLSKKRELQNMFYQTYKYLNTNCTDKNCLKRFENTPCIFYKDRLFLPRNMVFTLDTILSDYLFKVPHILCQYRPLLQLIGVTETPNHTHYSAVLEDIFKDLSFIDEKKRQEMSVSTFSLFISSLRDTDTPETINLDPVSTKVLSDDMSIVSLQDVIYVDNTILKTHIQHFPSLCNIKFLYELSPDSFGSCKPPICLRVKYLSEIIVEQLMPVESKKLDLGRQRQADELEYLIKCYEFAKGLIRIYYAGTKGSGDLKLIRIKNGIVKDISKEPQIDSDKQFLSVFEMLHKLSVKIVDSISVNVTQTQTGECITRNDIYDCYIENSVLFVTSTRMSNVRFYHNLTNTLNLYLTNIFNQMEFNLTLCLSCDYVSDIMQILDTNKVQRCPLAFTNNISLPVPPQIPTSSKLSIVTPQQQSKGVSRHALLSLMNTTPDPVTSSPGTIIASPHDEFTAKLWIRTAQCDLRAAEKLISENSNNSLFPPHACTNCFECAMKTCIAILYINKYRGASTPCQRNLDILLGLVKTYFKSNPLYEEFSSNCIFLLNFDENAKNPFMIPGSCCIPMEYISLTTAKEAIKNATNLLEVVKKEFPTFIELMYGDNDDVWVRPTSQSLLMTQLDNCELLLPCSL